MVGFWSDKEKDRYDHGILPPSKQSCAGVSILILTPCLDAIAIVPLYLPAHHLSLSLSLPSKATIRLSLSLSLSASSLEKMNDLMSGSFSTIKDQSPMERDIELGTQLPVNKADYGMEDFFKKVREIEQLMEKLSTLLQKLQEANEESKSVTKASAMKAIKQRMEKDVDGGSKVARTIKIRLQEIDKDNLINRSKPGCEKGTGVDRSRTAMTGALKKKLINKMHEFQKLRETIQDEYREVVERRVFTVTGTRPTDDIIDRLIDTGNSDQIFQKAVQEMGRGQVIDALEEIQERHDVVKDIEKRLLELHQIFMDMAVLAEAQGEMLDNIENQVANAVNHVQSGTDALHTAKNLQKKSRKCMMIAIIILLIIAIIIVLSVLKPWKK